MGMAWAATTGRLTSGPGVPDFLFLATITLALAGGVGVGGGLQRLVGTCGRRAGNRFTFAYCFTRLRPRPGG
jgi:hypothetical protein